MIDISNLFNKVETTFAVNAIIEIFGGLLMIFVIITALTAKLEKGLLRYVVLAAAFTFVAVVGDAVAALFRGMPGTGARWAVLLGNFFGAFGSHWCAVSYFLILLYVYKDVDLKTYRIFQYIVLSLCTLMTLFVIVSQFTGWLYTISDENIYKRGPLFFVSGIYTVVCIAIALIYMIVRRKQSDKKISLNAALYILIPFAGIVLQYLFYGGVFLQISLFILMLSVLYRVQRMQTERILEQQAALSQREVELAQSKDQMLLGQVRPHFIYNALSAIRHIEGNPPETKQAITDFANYMRGNLSALSSEELISIEKELEHVKTYVGLEKLRFGDKIKVDFDVQDTAFSLPPLSVQILVENAIKHGITAKYDGGTVSVRIWREGDTHIIEVKDDGVGFDPSAIKDDPKHIGLNSVRNRLSHFVSGEMQIRSTIGEGSVIVLKIPDKKEQR